MKLQLHQSGCAATHGHAATCPCRRRLKDDSRELSYCERVTATSMSAVHVREIGPEGRKLGGGIPNEALCGADVLRGWDLPTDVPSTIEQYAAIPQNQPGRLCLDCVAIVRSA